MNDVSGVLHDPAGEEKLTAIWTGMTGRTGDFEVEVKAARRQILSQNLSSEMYSTAAALFPHRPAGPRHA